jgi:3-deoxy-D-manno-octulosonic-acid transferase
VTGSIKFDRIETDRQNPRAAELRRLFGLRKSEKVFIAGSTQDPEERFSLESYIKLRTKHPELRLIVVPRHKERFDDVAKLIEVEYKLPLIRRSQVTSHTTALTQHEDPQHEGPGTGAKGSEPPVILLDTLGELSACWGLADVAFVGGSLTRRGGQNMIEPAGYGAALLFGPNTWNFKDVVELLLSEHAAEVVQDSVELTTRIDGLLSNPASAAELGERARQVVLAQRGATAHTIELISRMRPAADSAVRDSEIRAA